MMTNIKRTKIYKIIADDRAQLLTEVLVAMAVGGILIVAATAAIVSVIRQNYESRSGQTAASVNYDVLSKAKTYANSDWHNIYNLSHGTSSPYYIVSSATSSLSVGLAGYWKFDETGATAIDSSGNSNNGTLGAVTHDTVSNCIVGTCAHIGGAQLATIPSSSTLNITNAITISYWFYPKNSTAGYASHPLQKWTSTTDANYVMYFFGGTSGVQNYIGFYANAGGAWSNVSPLYHIPALNSWYHVVWTYTSSGGGYLYVNGSLISGTPYGSGVLATNSAPFYIGDDSGDSNENIDDFRIYSRALSVDEIKQLYNSPPNLGYSIAVSGQESVLSNDIQAGLVGYWKFDEGEGTTAFDYSGTGNIGTLMNSPTWTASSSCQVGGCLSFDGSSNYVSVNSDPLPSTNRTSISYGAWIKRNGSVPAYGRVIDKRNNAGGIADYALLFDSTGTNVYCYSYINNVAINGTLVSVPDATWTHVVCTYDGSFLNTYINGLFISKIAASGNIAYDSSGLFGIGAYAAGSSGWNFYKGNIDDVRVYNRALSANEISQLYNSSVYTRYFYVSNVNRDGSGNIAASGTDDPSTQQITAVTTRADGGVTQFSEYLTRSSNAVFTQSSWSGGSGQDGPITSPTNTYSTSTSIVLSGTSLSCSAGTSANLTSSIIDTQSPLGSAINDIIWQGSVGGGGASFQLAPSNNSAGPWNYIGPTGGGSYYTAGPNTSISVTNVNNYRYVRYLIYLNCPVGQTAPIVNSVNINWSP